MGNLVKYWPLLATGEITKRFVIAHVFRISSAGDYTRTVGSGGFLVERMREDLDQRGVSYPDAWEARLFTYRHGEVASDAAAFLGETVACPAG